MNLPMDGLTDLQRRVLKLLTKIPKGKVTTYREIAVALGNPRLSRIVGNAVRENPYPVTIPCHRVIRSSGEVGGYDGQVTGKNVTKKIELLRNEGVVVDDNGKIDLGKYLVNGENLAKRTKAM